MLLIFLAHPLTNFKRNKREKNLERKIIHINKHFSLTIMVNVSDSICEAALSRNMGRKQIFPYIIDQKNENSLKNQNCT